jgi:hypothetical protein
MSEAPTVAVFGNGTPAPSPVGAAREELARTLASKRAQGYEVESETDTKAVLVMKGRRRWFGLSNGESVRYEVTLDEGGRATSRRLQP